MVDVIDEGLAEIANGDNEAIFDGSGGNSVGEAELLCLGDALIGAKGGANFSTETNLAKDDVFVGKFAPSHG